MRGDVIHRPIDASDVVDVREIRRVAHAVDQLGRERLQASRACYFFASAGKAERCDATTCQRPSLCTYTSV
jgi:hypothetical protein